TCKLFLSHPGWACTAGRACPPLVCLYRQITPSGKGLDPKSFVLAGALALPKGRRDRCGDLPGKPSPERDLLRIDLAHARATDHDAGDIGSRIQGEGVR